MDHGKNRGQPSEQLRPQKVKANTANRFYFVTNNAVLTCESKFI